MLTGSTDLGVHCSGGCGATLYSPFPVTAYGQTFSQMYVSNSGTVQFGDTSTNVSNYNSCLPSSSFSGPSLMPYWNYLDTDTNDYNGVGIFYRTYGTSPNRVFVIEWRGYNVYSGDYVNFSEDFTEGSTVITTVYNSTGGAYATVGAQNANSATSTQYSCNSNDGATYAGLQLTYTPTPIGGKPSAPTVVSATADPSSPRAYLHWSPPTSDGGSAITGYIVSRDGMSSAGDGPYTSPTLPADQRDATFGKLIPGDTYHLSVLAVNAYGNGPTTTVTFTEPTTGTKPYAPGIGTATSGKVGGPITATAAWSPAHNTGATAATGFKVYAYRIVNGKNVETEVSKTLAANLRSYVFQLDHSGQWKFKVASINAAGASPLSAFSNLVSGR